MRSELNELISEGKISIASSHIYKSYIVYKLTVIDKATIVTCYYCDLYKISCNNIIHGDKNNITKCKTLGIQGNLSQVRYIYEKMDVGNISLFLSRYLLKTLSQTF